MYTVAAHLVEQKTGLSFEHFLHKHFFRPLGMSSTHLQPNAAIGAGLGDRISTTYIWQDDDTYKESEPFSSPEAQGAGLIYTSANDYIKWVSAVMNQNSPVSPALYTGLTKPRIIENPDDEIDKLPPFESPTLYAAGWEIEYYRGYKIVQHAGSEPASGGNHFFLPQLKFGAVIFGNGDTAWDVAGILSREIIDEVLHIPKANRPDWAARQRAQDRTDDDEESKRNLERRKELCPDGSEYQPQETPLSAYTGHYFHPGYHNMEAVVKDESLFVDATDRSMGFTLSFEYFCNQSKFIAHLSDRLAGGDEELAAEFDIEDGNVVRMGLELEEDLDGLIWFDKVERAQR